MNFPWHVMGCQHKEDCSKERHVPICISGQNVRGLAGLILSCRECAARRSMDGVFSAQHLARFPVPGTPAVARRDQRDVRLRAARALQRGASNLYFPVLGIRPEHSAVVGCPPGGARGLLESRSSRYAT